MDRKSTLWNRLVSYKLRNNIIVLFFLIGIFVISIGVYLNPDWRSNEVISNVALAFITSLLATIFAMVAEIYVKYKSHVNDVFLEDIHSFGIEKLTADKKVYMKELLEDCHETIWISGYRLIMTNQLSGDIKKAIQRGASATAVLCPPWTESFKLVYGENEKVADNYFNVFESIYNATVHAKLDLNNYQIFFIDKPLFSDTYKVDQNLITGPYMHNKDEQNKRVTANDFFSYNLVKKRPLYNMVEKEFKTLCGEATSVLDWNKFKAVYDSYIAQDWNEAEKIENLKSALITNSGGNNNLQLS